MDPAPIHPPVQYQNHPSAPHLPSSLFQRPLTAANYALEARLNCQRGIWLEGTKATFHVLISFGERQPSNGTVRSVDRPDGETHFVVAYGGAPDRELHVLLERIYSKHGEVVLQPDGRDSTGKHWIKCLSKVQPGTSERPTEKATICVFSRYELATHRRHRRNEMHGKGKGKTSGNVKEWPPKVPGAVEDAPEHLFLLPWYMQLPFLNPAAQQALRERMENENPWVQRSERRRMAQEILSERSH